MEKEFVTYEQALKLKELGFDEKCLAFYNGKFLDSTEYDFDSCVSKDIGYCALASLKAQVFKWFRAKGFIICLDSHSANEHEFYIKWSSDKSILSDIYEKYEEMENALIDKLIEIVKEK
jgi:hypothetical protein